MPQGTLSLIMSWKVCDAAQALGTQRGVGVLGRKGGGINHIPNTFQRGFKTIPPKSDVGQTLSPGELTEPHDHLFLPLYRGGN